MIGLGAAAFGVLAAACGQASPPVPAPPTQGTATQAPQATPVQGAPTATPAAAPTAQPATSGSPVNVKYWDSLDAGMDVYMKQQLAAFANKQPAIHVDFQQLPFDQFTAKLLASVAGGGAPDLTYCHPSWVTLFAGRSAIVDLDPFIKADANFHVEDFYEQVAAYFVFQGKRYCLPGASWPTVTYFDKTLFQKLGVPLPTESMKGFENATDAWTWDKALELAQRLTQGSGADKTFGFSDGYGVVPTSLVHLSQIIYSYGGEVWSEDLKKTLLSDPAAIKAIQFQADLITKYHAAPLPAESKAIPQGVNSGRYAMWMWNRSEVPGFHTMNADIGMAPFPRGPNGRVLRDGPKGFCILPSSQVKDQAFQFLEWFVGPMPGDPGGQEWHFQAHYSIPIRKSLANDATFVKNLLPWEDRAVYVDASTRVRVLPLVARFSEVDKLYATEWDKIIYGQATVADAMNEFTSKANPLLA
jgi:multiple sugar transport system substrate-binding protein